MLIRLPLAAVGIDADDGIVRGRHWPAIDEAASLLAEVRGECESLRARTVDEARAQVDAAAAEAQALREQARTEAQQMRDDAAARIDEEIARGFAHGEQQASRIWHERHAQLQARHAQRTQELEHQLADVVMAAVRRIIDSEPPGALFGRALGTVQELLRGAQSVTLRVCEAEVSAATETVARWSADGARPFVPEVCADFSLKPGSCVFVSDLGTVEASLDAQLAGLRYALERVVGQAIAAATTTSPSTPAEGSPQNTTADEPALHEQV